MQLTKHTDYAFRILIYVASMSDERTTIQKMAESLGVSKDHMKKIVQKLASEGWVDASRGKNGGVSLGIAPDQLSLKDVFELMEQTLAPVNCDSPVCVLKPNCELKNILFEAQAQFTQYLDRFTLNDILNKSVFESIKLIE